MPSNERDPSFERPSTQKRKKSKRGHAKTSAQKAETEALKERLVCLAGKKRKLNGNIVLGRENIMHGLQDEQKLIRRIARLAVKDKLALLKNE